MRISPYILALFLTILWSCNKPPYESQTEEWESIFNGQSLDGWTPKFYRMDAGQNYKNTFRLTDSLLHVSYDQYDSFNSEFGHLFYEKKYSNYRVRTTYRFLDRDLKNRPDWAFANNGLMLHSQQVNTMTKDQPFPLSIEFQLLQGEGRPTGRFCTPGCEVNYEGNPYPNHCHNEYQGPEHPLETWVTAEAIVYGDSLVHHLINGDTVETYTNLKIGGDMSAGLDTLLFQDGDPLADGYISVQAEGHDTQFGKIEVLNLCGCMDPKATNYKAYYIKDLPESCVYQ